MLFSCLRLSSLRTQVMLLFSKTLTHILLYGCDMTSISYHIINIFLFVQEIEMAGVVIHHDNISLGQRPFTSWRIACKDLDGEMLSMLQPPRAHLTPKSFMPSSWGLYANVSILPKIMPSTHNTPTGDLIVIAMYCSNQGSRGTMDWTL